MFCEPISLSCMIVLYTMYPVLVINPCVRELPANRSSRKELMVSKMVVLQDVVYRNRGEEKESG